MTGSLLMQAVLGAAGALSLWLAPVQARILPVTDAMALVAANADVLAALSLSS